MTDEDLMDDSGGGRDETIRVPITRELDLHTFQPRDVESVVREYLEEARQLKFSEVRIIHGKGIGFQREVVRKILAASPFVLSFGDDPSPRGGKGATLARLRL